MDAASPWPGRRLAGRTPRILVMADAFDLEAAHHATQDLPGACILGKPLRPATICNALAGDQPCPPREDNDWDFLSADRAACFSGQKILLVEDEPVNQLLASELLSSAGLVVTIADNGQEALDCLRRDHFACVLMDVQMPVMDGLEASREIRRHPQWHSLPIIAMTAGALAEERQQTCDAGMNEHVTKPINFENLFATLYRWIGPAAA